MRSDRMPAADVLAGLLGAARDQSGEELDTILRTLDDESLYEVGRSASVMLLDANMSMAEDRGLEFTDISPLLLFPGDDFLEYEDDEQLFYLRLGVYLTAQWSGPVSKIDLVWRSMNYIERFKFVFKLVVLTRCFADVAFGEPS